MDKNTIKFLIWLYNKELECSEDYATRGAISEVREHFMDVFGVDDFVKGRRLNHAEDQCTPLKKGK